MEIKDFVLGFIIPHETEYNPGGSVKVERSPSDHGNANGGCTKYGIDSASHPHIDVADLTLDGAVSIYLAEFSVSFAQNLLYPAQYAFFDIEVNSGPGRAAKCAQEAAGVTADGVLGPISKAAIKAQRDQNNFTNKMLDSRIAFYRRLVDRDPTQQEYLEGWLNRTADLRQFLKLT